MWLVQDSWLFGDLIKLHDDFAFSEPITLIPFGVERLEHQHFILGLLICGSVLEAYLIIVHIAVYLYYDALVEVALSHKLGFHVLGVAFRETLQH